MAVASGALSALVLTSGLIAADVNTSALSQNGWYSDDTRADGTGSESAGTNLVSDTLTDDPEATASGTSAHDSDIMAQIQFGTAPGGAPAGEHQGAVHLQIGATASGKSQISHRIDDGTGHGPGSAFGPGFAMTYSWMGDGTPTVTASVKFGIKTTDFGSTGVSGRTGENVWDKVLIYEPGNLNGGTSNGTWQTETVDWSNGRWWFFDRTTFGSTIGSPMTLEDMSTSTLEYSPGKTVADVYNLITAVGAHITSVQVGIGSGNANGSVYVNEITTNAYRSGDTTTFGFGPPVLTLTAPSCVTDTQVEVDVLMTGATDLIVGGQFFLEYDNAVLDFVSASVGDAPFDIEVFESVNEGAGTIDYAVGVFGGGPGTMADTVMATLLFDVIPADLCTPTADLVTFRPNTPPTRLTNLFGDPIAVDLVDLAAIAIDPIAPTITYCPPDLTIECVEDADPGLPYAMVEGGVGVYYNDNGGGENPLNQAYLKAQFSYGNDNGALLNFSSVPLTGIPFSWYDLYQAVPDQFGLDFVLPAPTNDGSVIPPVLTAYDNGDNSLPGAVPAGPVTWAINGYTGGTDGPSDPLSGVINSLIRGDTPPAAGDVVLTRNDLSLSGTVYTLDLAGYLVSDGVHHWYTIGTPDGMMSAFGLNGLIHFSGTLTYDAFGDDGSDLLDFYEGTITLTANFPSSATGFPLAIDNCTLFPASSYVDVDNGGSGDNGDPLVITRTWTFTDDCGNTSDCVQTITVEDVTAPTFLFVPADLSADAEAGGCTASFSLAEIGEATATDNCLGAPIISWMRSDGAPNLDDPFDTGVTTITWFADDGRGNIAMVDQTVTVSGVSAFDVVVELGGTVDSGPFTRCITFEFTEAGCAGVTSYSAEMTFSGGVASATLLVPCGDYDCVTARDELHTLRRDDLDDFGIVGVAYVADFTGADALVGGNLNDDAFIDILDFGVFVGEFGSNYGTGDTTCGTTAPHADINGDGLVDVLDFSFVQINFLQFEETGCCTPFASPALAGNRKGAANRLDAGGPVRRISLRELERRGMSDLRVADLNDDGWLDVADIAAFLGGSMP